MNEVKLNLARKWRSKQFSEIIGQELPVRMLKNSLYRDHYFPVYLFSGQRGCGKTTTARVFAAAVNCEQLSSFQKNPKASSLPCLQCGSCLAMTAGKHPDFIEMDAASHTGVDNVRSIIESSSLMPLMGSKKIYLIDEAHMLSKAAFNALLKIMEEPPASVIFILATTDAQKIIETVKSRCFQLFFDPVSADYLLNHLTQVCQKENIRFDTEGLELIIKQTEGSVRDALNMVEQVRFASNMITKAGVLSVLGHLDDERIVALAELVIKSKPKQLLLFLQQHRIVNYRAEYIWQRLMVLIHALLWIKYGVKPDDFVAHFDTLQTLARGTTIGRLHFMLSLFAQNELLFSRTTAQHSFLEMILLQLCFDSSKSNNEGGSSPVTQQVVSSSGDIDEICDDVDAEDEVDEEEDEDDEELEDEMHEKAYLLAWNNFLRDLSQIDDPILCSLFQQGQFASFDTQSNMLTISFPKDLVFFEDTLMGAERIWKPLLVKLFQVDVQFLAVYDRMKDESSIKTKVHVQKPMPQEQKKSNQFVRKEVAYAQNGSQKFQKKSFGRSVARGIACDVSDKRMWVKSNMLLDHFPGTVYELPATNKIEHVPLESFNE